MSCGGGSCEEAGEAVAGLLAALVLLCVARNALALVCFPPRRVPSSGGGVGGLSGRAPRRILEGAPSNQGAGRPRSALKRPSILGRGTGAAAPTGKPSEQQRRWPASPSEGGRGAKPSAPGPHRRAPRSPDRGGGEEEAGAAVLLRWLGAPVAVLEAGRAAAEEEEATVKKRPPPKAPRGPEQVLMEAAEAGFRAPGPLLLLRARTPPDPASAGKVVFDAEWVHCVVGGPETPRGPPRSNPRDGRTARFGQ